jgi:hypothetical protein
LTGGHLIRERALQVVLALVGLLFLAGIYPLLKFHANAGEQMLGSVYVTLGFFSGAGVAEPVSQSVA